MKRVGPISSSVFTQGPHGTQPTSLFLQWILAFAVIGKRSPPEEKVPRTALQLRYGSESLRQRFCKPLISIFVLGVTFFLDYPNETID